MRNRKFIDSIRGKGYYIALVLCAVAIGVSGFLYYRSEETPNSPDLPASVQDPHSTLPNTTPGQNNPTPTSPDATTPKPNTRPGKITKPVAGETVLDYAMDCLNYNPTTRDWRVHNGIDIAAEAGTVVCAAADGTVYAVFDDETMGSTVVIRHADGYTTKYASLRADIAVEPGQAVTSGQTIGYVGNTAMLETAIGEHVHFSVSLNGEDLDPAEFLAP